MDSRIAAMVLRLGVGRGAIMGHGLAHRVKHQPDAHPGGKQHGDPGEEGEIGGGIVGPELERAGAPQRQNEDGSKET